MAKVDLNSALKLVRGSVGNLVFKRHRKNEVILSKRATHKDTKWSKDQRKGRQRWSDAAKYANAVWADPERRAVYEAIAKKRKAWRVYNLITGDFMNAPEIQAIELKNFQGRASDVIGIRATDDIGVVAVQVIIRSAQGRKLEQGSARQASASLWTYSLPAAILPGTPIAIEVTAQDRPGNRSVQRTTFTVPDRRS